VFLFILNALGLGCGPVFAGILSDVSARWFGPAEGLRFAMVVLSIIVSLSVVCFAMARRTIEDDVCS
jgi:hypothetical protein